MTPRITPGHLLRQRVRYEAAAAAWRAAVLAAADQGMTHQEIADAVGLKRAGIGRAIKRWRSDTDTPDAPQD